jgi:Ca-activated chloride channel homolog
MTASLTLSSALSSHQVSASTQPQLVYLLVEIGGGEGAHSLPVNLGLVIDTSDSMKIRLVTEEQFAQMAGNGSAKEVLTDGIPSWQIEAVPDELVRQFPRKIDYVQDALSAVSEFLRPTDRFSLAAFASWAEMLIPSSPGTARLRLTKAAQDLEGLQLGDETHIAEGLSLAFTDVYGMNSSRCADRIILLTDGHTRDIRECYAWARRAREVGLAITTMGVGAEFNEDLLIPLAEMTGGNAYYIETPEQIPAVFRRELDAALGVRFRNLKLHVRLSRRVGLRGAYRVLPELGGVERDISADNLHTFYLGGFGPATPPVLLLELVVPPLDPGNYRLARMGLSWNDPEGNTTRNDEEQAVIIQLTTSSTPAINERVMNIVEKVAAYKLGIDALEVVENDDRASAIARLRQAATQLAKVGEKELAVSMSVQADYLEQQGGLDPNAAKQLRYNTRRITQRLVL